MQSYKSVTILLVFLCLSSEISAQYTKLLKGQPSPYDTGIVIHLSEYRKIREKITTADTLVHGYRVEISKAHDIIAAKDTAQQILSATIQSNSRTIETHAKTISNLNEQVNAALAVVNRRKKWFERPGYIFGGGAVVGIVLKTLLSK